MPPSQVARPLPVRQEQRKNTPGKQGPRNERKPKRKHDDYKGGDDAPRAFKRLMAFAGGKKPRSGLDNGDEPTGKNKKRKATQDAAPETDEKNISEIPKIRPGERMSDFAARVDATLPISGLVNKSVRDGKDPLGLKVWRTNKERKMHKLYDEWREEDRKAKEKREEELELQAEKELEEEEAGVSWKLNMQGGASSGTKKKKGKRSKYLGEVDDKEDDPWEALKKKRGETKAGLHDVVLAPPEFAMKSLKKKKTVGGAAVEVDGVPKAAGSLRRREELQSIRNDVVASYRKMMEEKRPALQS